jgi:transcriptional regulator with XRE-family HTH domain
VGFKENLKSELTYKGILVKELAAKTGISKHTLDNYLNTRSRIPSADIAVKIAKALDVSVEYLITGIDDFSGKIAMSHDIRLMLQNMAHLNDRDRKLICDIVQLIQAQRKN